MSLSGAPTIDEDLQRACKVRLLNEVETSTLVAMLHRVAPYEQDQYSSVDLPKWRSLDDCIESIAGSTDRPIYRFRLTPESLRNTSTSFVTTLRTSETEEEIVSVIRKSGKHWIVRANDSPMICTPKRAVALGPFAWAWAIPFEEDHGVEGRSPAKAGNQRIRSILGFLWAGTREERLSVVFCIGVAIGLGLLPPILYRQIIDTALPAADLGFLWSIVLLLFVWNASQMGAIWVQNFAMIRLQNRSIELLLSAIWSKVFRLPVSYFRNQMSGAVAHQCTVVSELGNRLSTAFIQGGVSSIVAACSVVVAAWISLKLFLAVVPIVILESAIHGWILYQSRQLATRLESRCTEYVGSAVDWTRGITKVRSTQSEPFVTEKLKSAHASILENDFRLQLLEDNKKSVGLFFQLYGSIIVFGFGFAMLADPVFTIGTFAAFLASYRTFAAGILGIAGLLAEVIGARATMRLVMPLLMEPPEDNRGKTNLGPITGRIELKHISFRYPQAQTECLSDISFSCRPGEIVGIVGPSGAGKSTLLRLLLGFEKPQSGRILIDGMDIRNIDVNEVRRQIGCVLQSDTLIQGTIRDNLDIRRRLTDESLWQLLDWVDMRNEVESMGLQLDTLLNVAGGNLSGGQRQRLLIARALANAPQLLILDEALSGLDHSQQDKILKMLRTKAITTIMVTHRLDTLGMADQICSLSAANN